MGIYWKIKRTPPITFQGEQKPNDGKDERTFRIQQAFDSELVFGYSESVVESFHRAQPDNLIPAEGFWPVEQQVSTQLRDETQNRAGIKDSLLMGFY